MNKKVNMQHLWDIFQRTTRGRATKVSRIASTPPPSQTTPSLFHGTVVPAMEFDVNKDVKTFHSSFGRQKFYIFQ